MKEDMGIEKSLTNRWSGRIIAFLFCYDIYIFTNDHLVIIRIYTIVKEQSSNPLRGHRLFEKIKGGEQQKKESRGLQIRGKVVLKFHATLKQKGTAFACRTNGIHTIRAAPATSAPCIAVSPANHVTQPCREPGATDTGNKTATCARKLLVAKLFHTVW